MRAAWCECDARECAQTCDVHSRFKDIDVDVVAVLNDTTGTMLACAFQESTCNIGLICKYTATAVIVLGNTAECWLCALTTIMRRPPTAS